MANKNILMQKKNGTGWDVLYPISLATNIFDSNGVSLDARLKSIATVAASSDVFTLDLASNRNFSIEITDANPKTLTFANIPASLNFIDMVQVKMVCTNVGTITFPSGTVWLQNVIPDFLIGKTYYLSFIRASSGWHVYAMGGF
jgi:hypothetical protein